MAVHGPLDHVELTPLTQCVQLYAGTTITVELAPQKYRSGITVGSTIPLRWVLSYEGESGKRVEFAPRYSAPYVTHAFEFPNLLPWNKPIFLAIRNQDPSGVMADVWVEDLVFTEVFSE